MIKKFLFTFLLLFLNRAEGILAQATQTIKGVVTDRTSDKPLVGASVSLVGSSSGTTTDNNGRYFLRNVPIGRQRIAIDFIGYKQAVIPEILVTAGKEVILDVSLEQSVTSMQEIVIKGVRAKKGAAANEYAIASSRSFNMDEVTRFSGGRNDPSKMASNFAGVISNNDSRNDIVVRGNSPSGVLWRIEGIPSPNPNHYSTLGTTGGPITALNTNALNTSDFLSGAFPAEFGNATAAVFDIQFRSGNSEKHEQTIQLNAFSGMEAMFEGPLNKKKNGSSYLAGYRYSFAEIANWINLNIGTDAVPKYQDWVYNITLWKGKSGKWNFYGMGGFSNINFIGSEIDSTDFYSRPDIDAYNNNHFYLFGVKHVADFSAKAYIKTVVSFSKEKSYYDAYQYPVPVPPYRNRWLVTKADDKTNTYRVSSYINSKESVRFSWRAGVTGEMWHLNSNVIDKEGKAESDPFLQVRSYDDLFTLLQGFWQGKYKISDQFSISGGLHGMLFTFNQRSSIEHRASINYQINDRNSVYTSYGLHSQIQPFPVYLYQRREDNGTLNSTNRTLGFTKAHHFVAGYEKSFAQDWRVKAELYYQRLFDVPVERSASGFSMLNAGNNFVFPEKTNLVNSGTGTNRGVELTVEKFLSKGYYMLATVSLFKSKYKGSDGVERNTAFNYERVFNFLGGKELVVGKSRRNAITFDTRLSSVGGRYETPVDVAASLAAGKEVLDESRYNNLKLEDYLRWDTKFGFRTNSKRRKLSQTFYLDFQNVTNRQNIFLRRFNAARGVVGNVYQLGFFPDVMYRVQW